MPDVAVEQTMAGHMRMNWLGRGHSPTPYGIIGFIGRIPYGPPATAKLSIGDQFWQIGVTGHF